MSEERAQDEEEVSDIVICRKWPIFVTFVTLIRVIFVISLRQLAAFTLWVDVHQ